MQTKSVPIQRLQCVTQILMLHKNLYDLPFNKLVYLRFWLPVLHHCLIYLIRWRCSRRLQSQENGLCGKIGHKWRSWVPMDWQNSYTKSIKWGQTNAFHEIVKHSPAENRTHGSWTGRKRCSWVGLILSLSISRKQWGTSKIQNGLPE